MNTYEIRITNITDLNELHTFDVTVENTITLADNLETTANYSEHIELELKNGTYLEIDQHSEHGYNANLYESKEAYNKGNDPISGGLCTGTVSDAIKMALNSY